jgi:hypothetical protein
MGDRYNPSDIVIASEPPSESADRVRMALASGASAAVLAALLAGAAFGLQAVALPRPTRGQLIAAKTLRWLNRQDAVESVALVGGRRVSSVCIDATVGPLGRSRHRLAGSLLMTGRRRLVETRFASYRLGSTLREEDGPLPAIRAALAGCPRVLGRRIGRFLNDRAPVGVKRFVRGGAQLLRLSFRFRESGLLLLVDQRTSAPVAVRIERRGTGWSYLAPAGGDLARPALRLSRQVRLAVEEDA